MNPFTKSLNINQYIKEGHDINVINPKNGEAFVSFLLRWLTSSYSNSSDKFALFQLLCSPKLKTENLKIQHQLYKYIPDVIEYLELYPDDMLYENFPDTIENGELNILIEKRNVFSNRLDLTYTNKYKENILFLIIEKSTDNIHFYNTLKIIHPQFNQALKQINLNNENIWHKLISSSATLAYEVKEKEFIYLNEKFPEGKYLKNKLKKTPLDLIDSVIEQYKKANYNDQVKETEQIKSLIQKMILKDSLDNNLNLVTKKRKPGSKI